MDSFRIEVNKSAPVGSGGIIQIATQNRPRVIPDGGDWDQTRQAQEVLLFRTMIDSLDRSVGSDVAPLASIRISTLPVVPKMYLD